MGKDLQRTPVGLRPRGGGLMKEVALEIGFEERLGFVWWKWEMGKAFRGEEVG